MLHFRSIFFRRAQAASLAAIFVVPAVSPDRCCKMTAAPHHCNGGVFVGTWLSLVEHSLGVRGVGSSNLPVPTKSLASVFFSVAVVRLFGLSRVLAGPRRPTTNRESRHRAQYSTKGP
jgi:hypothetical protein